MDMKIKFIDVIGICLIAVGIAMTALMFFTSRGPESEVKDFSIHEIPSPPRPSI
jgi:hypothetical protein